ncbi:hypothetical protein P153DRAFT_318023 [Dothidotthia symphoricarpi CBS 119687]|uniref:Uncharacterized protein n=1 Tax=Dothidotthia symphoricarpi CBS 119687 TaxID=1392245 RepID=A0A6A6AAU4_9PLEO|nr:uncharacterized protein P153DRAFT_318023 [Dothidotthia symphoricarpi CBS 119687]KAF2128333.1 hypothetical protein P153DRAFT_318023 [Dothidotthia symphoricarpi CBS 119687]
MSTILHTASGAVGKVGNQLQYTSNRILPPKQREETLEKIRAFVVANPKVAAFLVAQIALTGVPLVLFLAFATSVLLVSLTTALLTALTGAFLFTLFTVGFALLFVIPTLFVTSCTATFLFSWGLTGYYILQRFNEGETPVKRGTRVGDRFQDLTGGKLAWLVDGTDDASAGTGETLKVQVTNGSDAGGTPGAQVLEGSGRVKVLRITDVKKSNGTQKREEGVENGHDLVDENRNGLN